MIKVRLEKIIRNILVKGPFKKISMRDFPTFSYIWTSRILTLLNITKQEPINPLTWSLEKSTPSRRSLPALEVPPPPFPGNYLLTSLLNLVFIWLLQSLEKRPAKEMMVEIVMTWNNTEVYFAMALSSRYDRWGCTFLISYPDFPWTEWDQGTR